MNARAILERMKLSLTVQTDFELSERLRVPVGTINTWKKRDRIPFDIIDRFSDDFDVSLDWIVKGTSPQGTSLTVDQIEARAFQLAVRMTLLVNGMDHEEVKRQMNSIRNFQRLIVAQVGVQVGLRNMPLEEAFELQEKTIEKLARGEAEKLADFANLV